jgi:hypothetical protein
MKYYVVEQNWIREREGKLERWRDGEKFDIALQK